MRRVKHPCLPKWRERVAKAHKRGYFTRKDARMAEKWNTCAFGEARERYNLPSQSHVHDKNQLTPIDRRLEHLGYDFAATVHNGSPEFWDYFEARPDTVGHIEDAEKVLDKIEARLTTLMSRA